MKFSPKILSVGCWNIEGIYKNINGVRISKLEDETFENTLKKFDILCLQETHTSQNDRPNLKNFVATPHCRKISSNKRYFGGMLLFIRRTISKGVKVNSKLDVDSLEIVLDKGFFGFTRDIRILFTYASPTTSPYTRAREDTVFEKIETYIEDGRNSFLVMGDLNGRTKTEDDFVRDSEDKHSPICNIPCYTVDQQIKRNNRDSNTVDEHGKIILEICKSNSLRILNGRTKGDEFGTFTRYPKRADENPSVIDYTLCGESLMPLVHSFSVLPFTELSDHCCTSTFIKTNRNLLQDSTQGEVTKVNPNPPKIKFDRNRVNIFQENVQASEKLGPLKTLVNTADLDESKINVCVLKLNELIVESAIKTCPVNKTLKKKKKTSKKCWFNKDCSTLQGHLRRLCRDLAKHPFDKQKRQTYIKARNEYKRTCRKAEQKCRHDLTKKLLKIGLEDPKSFWNIIKQMNNWGKEKDDETDQITPLTWKEYFTKLLNDRTSTNALPIDETTPQPTPTFNPILDRKITMIELRKALTLLKNHKAAGCDRISAEYLKAFAESFDDILLTLLQKLFTLQIYPSEWASNFLKPIYKKGECIDPDNYRGLAIGAALAKLYSLILLGRLTEYIDKKDLISVNQIGFMTCTSDHIFLLQTIIEKVVKKNKNRLYAVFIDFKKAYDTVDRGKLFRRLQEIGINGPFFKNIRAMYKTVSYKIKLKGGYLDPIESNLGLKQGCPLSPMMFNLYIDDMKDIFDAQCDPVTITDTNISHFLYADDLVLVSLSPEGLQRSLDKISDYATTKSLTISIKKSKSMIFNLGGRLIDKKFYINDEPLEPVKSFCYLGFEVVPSGVVTHAKEVLNDKAKKALHPLLGAIAKFNLPVKLAIRLFHTYISPILLYGVENWSILSDLDIERFQELSIFQKTEKSITDTVHKKLLKFVLGVSKTCHNMAVYGETGEIPLSLKGYRLMLNYWKRLSTLPDKSLAKKALIENANIRTNWLITIEKLVRVFRLIEVPAKKFKDTTKTRIPEYFTVNWKNKLLSEDISRLRTYKTINSDFTLPKHLGLPYENRKVISKIRCSNHPLAIEKGRQKRPKTPRDERICILCDDQVIEDEEHFLLRCDTYSILREEYQMNFENIPDMLNTDDQYQLSKYLISSYELRLRLIQGRERD